MKRCLVLVALLALFLLPIVNPSLSSIPAAIGGGSQFIMSADGDESSESIISFSETTADDVTYVPDFYDAFWNNASVATNWGYEAGIPYAGGQNGHAIVADGTASDGYSFEGWATFDDPNPGREYQVYHFDYETAHGQQDPKDLALYLQVRWRLEDATNSNATILVETRSAGDTNTYTAVSEGQSESWTMSDVLISESGSGYWIDEIHIKILEADIAQDTGNYSIFIDWWRIIDATFYTDQTTGELQCNSGYQETFFDVSDCSSTLSNHGTDGDVGYCDVPGDNGYDRLWSNAISLPVGSYYVEGRMKSNITSPTAYMALYAEDDYGGALKGLTGYYYLQTTWKTFRFYFTTEWVGESLVWVSKSSNAHRVYADYWRISPADECGWQHDGSTAEGWAEAGSGSLASDGDKVTFTSGAGADSGYVTTDTTATRASISDDYYQFYEFSISSVNDADSDGNVWKLRMYGDDGNGYPIGYSDDTGVFRGNVQALGLGDIFRFTFYLQDAGESVTIDYVKLYSIANWSITQSGAGTDDYLYVDSNVLYGVVDSGYIQLNDDPALSVSDTYSIWNLTTGSSPPEFRHYAGGHSAWSSGETRGATISGTITSCNVKFESDGDLSAIKFIEDGTAPSVLRISATPPEPDDTESITLSALATDTVEVYKVWFRPITGPTGYSQTDYEATEQADNLWTYEFSNLDEGYWAFKAIAFDGANNSTLDADSVIDFWVREKELIISNTLYTETSTQCSFAGQTNVACDYLIYDDDVEQESGNKAAGSFFLDWNKQTSVGTHNWGIKFYTASATDWHNGSYEVLTTTLLVTEYGIRTTTSYAYLHGYVNLNANYTVYEETVQVGTGSVSAGSFEFRWTKASSSVENVTVLFESGSQSYPVYSGYDVAAQVTFVVESWWMDLNLGVESYVEFYVLSSFENATVYVYDNNTLMTTVTESAGGAYSYFWMSESEGLHTITLNITHGATVHTRTRTYYIPDWAATGLVVRWDLWTFQDNYTMLELGSNWMNCTYYIYLNGSLVATSANDPVTLNFTRAINIGEYNLTILANASAQTYTIKNIRYIITEEGVTYDYSSVTGGRSVRYGDSYNYYTETTEPQPGVFIDQTTAAIISVGGFLMFFVIYLAARRLHIREILKTERVFGS